MTSAQERPPFYDTTEKPETRQRAEGPNPWALGDGPLPRNVRDLVAEIKALAAARGEILRHHAQDCECRACSDMRRVA